MIALKIYFFIYIFNKFKHNIKWPIFICILVFRHIFFKGSNNSWKINNYQILRQYYEKENSCKKYNEVKLSYLQLFFNSEKDKILLSFSEDKLKDELKYHFNFDEEITIIDDNNSINQIKITEIKNYNIFQDQIKNIGIIKPIDNLPAYIKNCYNTFMDNRINLFLCLAIKNNKNLYEFRKYIKLALSCYYKKMKNHANCRR
jgi:hypothetical protein